MKTRAFSILLLTAFLSWGPFAFAGNPQKYQQGQQIQQDDNLQSKELEKNALEDEQDSLDLGYESYLEVNDHWDDDDRWDDDDDDDDRWDRRRNRCLAFKRVFGFRTMTFVGYGRNYRQACRRALRQCEMSRPFIGHCQIRGRF